MKKIILILISLTTFAVAQSQIYAGLGYGYVNGSTADSLSIQGQNSSENSARFKVGYGSREAYAIEFSLDYIDSTPQKYAFDVALIKAFDFDIYVNPFAKIGFGAGTLQSGDSNTESLQYGSFNLGGGVYIPLNEHFDIELSYEYKNISYETQSAQTSNATGDTNTLYFGFNVRY